jgi:hypothetical protein
LYPERFYISLWPKSGQTVWCYPESFPKFYFLLRGHKNTGGLKSLDTPRRKNWQSGPLPEEYDFSASSFRLRKIIIAKQVIRTKWPNPTDKHPALLFESVKRK